MSDTVCDFCNTEYPLWRYPAQTFATHPTGGVSLSDWLACNACHDLIEADKRDALARRALGNPNAQMIASLNGEAHALSIIRGLHDQFFKNRTGTPESLISTTQ